MSPARRRRLLSLVLSTILSFQYTSFCFSACINVLLALPFTYADFYRTNEYPQLNFLYTLNLFLPITFLCFLPYLRTSYQTSSLVSCTLILLTICFSFTAVSFLTVFFSSCCRIPSILGLSQCSYSLYNDTYANLLPSSTLQSAEPFMHYLHLPSSILYCPSSHTTYLSLHIPRYI